MDKSKRPTDACAPAPDRKATDAQPSVAGRQRFPRIVYGLVLGFTALLGLMLLITLTGLRYMEATKELMHDVVTEHMAKLKLSTTMRIAARERTASLQRMALLTDPFERDEQWMVFNDRAGTFINARVALRALPLTPNEERLLADQAQLTAKAVPLQERVVELINAGRAASARQLLVEQAIPAQDRVLERLAALQDMQEQAAVAALASADMSYVTARQWMIGLCGSVLGLGIVIAAIVVYRAERSNRALQHAGEELHYRATHDDLTGLLNRSEFDRRLEQALESARIKGAVHVVCYLDIDLFKSINDTAGHRAGDELLRQVAARIRQGVRPTDLMARVGGDEFAVLFERCAVEDGLRRAEDLRRAVRETRFAWDTKSFNITVSVGVAPIAADSGNLSDVLAQIDDACRFAKNTGRNRVHVGGGDANRSARRDDIGWVECIHDALQHDELILYAQTVRAIDASAVPPHFEILLRLRDAAGTLVTPGMFLPIAERYHLMPEIDRAVIHQALAQLARRRASGGRAVIANINLSGQSLYDPEFFDFIVGTIRDTQVPPSWLCFEITETAAVANLSSALALVAGLRELGCQFALDDFGSGLSSFGYLKNLQVDYIKIDGLFVKHIADDPIDRAMVRSINEMAHVMGIRTIAECVETDAILRELRDIQVDFAQGYGISMPQPLTELLDGGGTAQTAAIRGARTVVPAPP